MLTHPHLRHPLTGAPIVPLGTTRSGRLIWPVLGGSQPTGEPAPASAGATPTPAAGASLNSISIPATNTSAGATVPAAPATATNATGTPEPAAQPGQQPLNPGVPWRELPLEDQVAYWQSQSKKHEGRQLQALGLKPGELEQLRAAATERDRLAQAGQTDAERAVAEAKQLGRQEALTEVGGKLVDAHMRVAIGARMTPEQVSGLLGNLDLRRFQTDTGDVDATKVTDFVATILPAAAPATAVPDAGTAASTAATAGTTTGQPGTGAPQRQIPDMGQGDRQGARPSGLAAGREIAAQRFGASARSAATQQ